MVQVPISGQRPLMGLSEHSDKREDKEDIKVPWAWQIFFKAKSGTLTYFFHPLKQVKSQTRKL